MKESLLSHDIESQITSPCIHVPSMMLFGHHTRGPSENPCMHVLLTNLFWRSRTGRSHFQGFLRFHNRHLPQLEGMIYLLRYRFWAIAILGLTGAPLLLRQWTCPTVSRTILHHIGHWVRDSYCPSELEDLLGFQPQSKLLRGPAVERFLLSRHPLHLLHSPIIGPLSFRC